MAFYIQIFDDHSNPEPVANFSDILTEAILARGVGFLCTEEHVERDIRDVINELFHTHIIIIEPPKITHKCEGCGEEVGVWHTYADGAITCTPCKDLINGV